MSNFLEGHLHIKRHEVAFLLYIAPRNSLILRKTVNVHGNVCQRVDNGLSLFNACHYLYKFCHYVIRANVFIIVIAEVSLSRKSILKF